MDFVYGLLSFACGLLVGCLTMYVYHHTLSIAYDIATIKGDIETLVIKYEQLSSKDAE